MGTRSGVKETDWDREQLGGNPRNGRPNAIAALSMGKGLNTVVGDHSGSDTCAEVIARLQDSKPTSPDVLLNNAAGLAILNLLSGIGVHVQSGDHAGGNRCVEVIAKARTAVA
jgi:hypothetical protein